MVAAPVKAFPVQAPFPPHAKGAAKAAAGAPGPGSSSASGTASGAASGPASGPDFGKLFREQAGTIPLPAGKAAAGALDTGSPSSPSEPGAKPASGVPESASSDVSDRAQSVPASAVLLDSPQALLLAQLRNKLHGVSADATASVNPQIGTAEASLPSSAAEKMTKAGESKDTDSLSSAKNAHHKLKEENAEPASANPAAPVSVMPLPAAGVPVAIAPAPLPPHPVVAAPSAKTQPANAANDQKSAERKAAPALSANLGESPAASPEHGAQAKTANQIPLPVSLTGIPGSTGIGAEAAAAAPAVNGAASGDPSSASSIAHTGHAPAELKPAAPSVIPTMLHSETPVLAPSHVEQPPSNAPATVTPAAGPPAAGATVLYDRIDQAAAPVVLHSGAQHISVGVHDPNLGWVEIQTQNTAGHVDAMLVTSSGQTHDSLAAQLPAMAQFLEQRDVRVGTLGVQQQMQNSGGGGAGAGNGGAMGSGTGYSGNGGSGAHPSGSERNPPRSAGLQPLAGAASRAAPGSASGSASEVEGLLYRPLSYINVRA